jgi:hypothetical protein
MPQSAEQARIDVHAHRHSRDGSGRRPSWPGPVILTPWEAAQGVRRSQECLASYTLGGIAYEQWSGDISHCKVGGQTTIILDPRDRRPLQSKDTYDRRWLLHGIQLLAVLISVWISIRFYRWSKLWL